MPDLLTHSIVAYGATARARKRTVTYMLLGTALPDAASVVVGLVLDRSARVLGRELAPWVLDGFKIFHAPIPFFLLAWLLALFWPPSRRAWFLVAIGLGGWLHIGLDIFQFHLDGPSYRPLYPLSGWAWEAGWISTEDSLFALPFVVPIGIAIWSWRRRQRKG